MVLVDLQEGAPHVVLRRSFVSESNPETLHRTASGTTQTAQEQRSMLQAPQGVEGAGGAVHTVAEDSPTLLKMCWKERGVMPWSQSLPSMVKVLPVPVWP